MKRKTFQKIALATIGLALGGKAISVNNTPVFASKNPGYNSYYWYRKPFQVYTTRNIKASLLKGNFLTTRHFIRRYKTIKKGTSFRLAKGGSSFAYWAIYEKSLPGLGKIEKSNGDTWVIRIPKTNWFKMGFPPAKFKNYTFSSYDGELGFSQITATPTVNKADPNDKDNLIALTGSFKNKLSKLTSPSDFIDNHFKFYGIYNGIEKKFAFNHIGFDGITNTSLAYNSNVPIRRNKRKTFEIDSSKKIVPSKIVIVAYDHGHKVGSKTLPVFKSN